MYAEFGNYDNSQWSVIKKIKLTNPNPTKEEGNSRKTNKISN